MSVRPVRVYQEDWWPFQNLPAALAAFSRETGIPTELSWDKFGVGSIETMFEHMVHSFTDDDPPFDLICTDEVMLRRFAVEGRVLVLNELMARDGITLDDVTPETRRAATLDGAVIGTLGIAACEAVGNAVNAAVEGRLDADSALARIHAELTALARPA